MYTNKSFWNFYYNYFNFNFYFFYLLNKSSKLIIRLKYGLYHYLFWIKVGCKNIKWKSAFTLYFLLDYIFKSLSAFDMYNYIITTLKHNYLPIRRSVFTISKGPMVRKKKSREQFMFKQIFVNIKKIIYFLDKKYFYKRFELQGNNINFIKYTQIVNLHYSFTNYKHLSSLFLFLNYNINFFNIFIKNISYLNFFIETNVFYLKKTYIYLNFNDMHYFHL